VPILWPFFIEIRELLQTQMLAAAGEKEVQVWGVTAGSAEIEVNGGFLVSPRVPFSRENQQVDPMPPSPLPGQRANLLPRQGAVGNA
jgi:hypothetical protein